MRTHTTVPPVYHDSLAYALHRRAITLGPFSDPPAAGPAPARPLRCLHLGNRVEFRPGCSGWTCRHACQDGRGEVRPGVECQTCPGYAADG